MGAVVAGLVEMRQCVMQAQKSRGELPKFAERGMLLKIDNLIDKGREHPAKLFRSNPRPSA